MTKSLISWDIYEISAEKSNLEGVMLRGRVRKFAILNNINLLIENASDEENKVRFAILANSDFSPIEKKIKEMIPNSRINQIKKEVRNPVLSKLKVNLEERYKL